MMYSKEHSLIGLLLASILTDHDTDNFRPNTSSNPMPLPTVPTQSSTPTIVDALWSHPFYKRIIGPLTGRILDISQHTSSAITSGTLFLCCNSSYSPSIKRGSHGWILATTNSTL